MQRGMELLVFSHWLHAVKLLRNAGDGMANSHILLDAASVGYSGDSPQVDRTGFAGISTARKIIG